MDSEDTKGVSSAGVLVKKPSEATSLSPSLKPQNKRVKNSKSSVSIQRSSIAPQKEMSVHSEGSSVERQKSDIPRHCECGPDLYTRVLGPTADETILTGLQTVIDLCNKLRVCGDKNESEDEPAREQDIPEKDTNPPKSSTSQTDSKKPTTTTSQTDRQIPKTSLSQTERNMVSAGFQVNPSVKNMEVQTLPFPQMVSEILQTAGLTPEMASKIMQTSFMELPEVEKASINSIFMQTSNPSLRSDTMQTTDPDLRSSIVQTTSNLVPKAPTKESVTRKDSSVIKSKAFIVEATKADEHKNISPPEPPSSTCRCCKCSSSSSSLRRESKTSEEIKPCICGKRKSKCICNGSEKKKASAPKEEQVPPLEVKYAITKISKFKEFTTYEVLKSTRSQPKQIPKTVEGIFVLKKNGGSSGDVKNSKDGSQRSLNGNGKKNGDSSSNKVKNGGTSYYREMNGRMNSSVSKNRESEVRNGSRNGSRNESNIMEAN